MRVCPPLILAPDFPVGNLHRLGRPLEATRYCSASDVSQEAAALRLVRDKARLNQELLKARAMEREEQAASGNVLPRDEWDLFAIEVVQQARDRFMRLPRLLCKHVSPEYHRVLQTEGARSAKNLQRDGTSSSTSR